MIPMVDMKAQYEYLREELEAAALSVIAGGQYIMGPNVRAFEQEAADYLGCQHAISCGSGTDALTLALRSLDIGAGDEVITTPFTFIATAESIRLVGARPVFVDIDPKTFNIDPNKLEAAITPATRALLPVHLFGQPANMSAIKSIASKHKLHLMEDCAQSFGAKSHNQYTGCIGEIGCFSFFPSKNLGACGDGGLITTQNDEIANTLRHLRDHGRTEGYIHQFVGYNSRLDDIQAAMLRVKLPHIDRFNDNRRQAARVYSEALAEVGDIVTPHEATNGEHVYHQYTLLTESRDRIREKLAGQDIASAIYYPIPLHQQPVFAADYADISLPVAERVAAQCLSLPMHPLLSDAQLEKIIAAVKSAF